jgi:glycosyltransferase involved in cell wall biosynthesis
LKILYFIGAFGPRYLGNEINRELVQELSARGHCCLVYAGVSPDELEGDSLSYTDGSVIVRRQLCSSRGIEALTREVGLRVLRYPRFLPLLAGLRHLLAEHRDVGVIHAEAVYPMSTIAALAALGHRAALVPSIQGGDLIDYPGYGYGRFRLCRRLIRWTFARAAMVRGNSSLMAERARELGCAADKLREVVVNIGARFFPTDDPIAERRGQARAEVALRHRLDSGTALVLSLGRLLPLKGYLDLLEATAVLARTGLDLHVLIAGPNFIDPRLGDQRRYLQKAIERLGLLGRAEVIAALDYGADVPRYLAAADLVVAAAHVDGMNKVVPEAASQATPAIVTRTTGIAPWVRRYEAGLVVEPRDPDRLAEAMRSLLTAPQERARLGANAARMALQFRTPVVANQLVELYAEARARVDGAIAPS